MIETQEILFSELVVGDIIVVGSIDEYNEKVTSIKKRGNYVDLTVEYKTWGNIYKFNQPRRNRKKLSKVTIVKR